MSKIITPDTVSMQVQRVDANNASPAQVIVERPGEVKAVVIGGYTKLEDAAVKIAAAMYQQGTESEEIPTRAVELAARVLEEAKRVESAPKVA